MATYLNGKQKNTAIIAHTAAHERTEVSSECTAPAGGMVSFRRTIGITRVWNDRWRVWRTLLRVLHRRNECTGENASIVVG